VEALCAALATQYPMLQTVAAEALGRLADPHAVPALIRAMRPRVVPQQNDEDVYARAQAARVARSAAAAALRKITGQDFGADVSRRAIMTHIGG